MRFSPINLVMPHYCCSCGAIGDIFCDYCKYDIISESVVECMACLGIVARYGDICKKCSPAYSRAWMVGRHRGGLRELVGCYKFDGVRAAEFALAAMLHEALPALPAGITVTSVPTARPHIRERGYDHAAILARKLARLRELPYAAPLTRLHTKAQRGASRKERLQQAESAFEAAGPLEGVYLLIDDVCTTGATLNYAAKALRKAGAREVWVAVISREPLD